MQQRAARLSMRKHGHRAHDGFHGVRVDDAFLDAGDEEGGFAAGEVVVEVDEEGEEGGLAGSGGRGVVDVGVGYGVDARGGPCAVLLLLVDLFDLCGVLERLRWGIVGWGLVRTDVTSVFRSGDISVHPEASVDASYFLACTDRGNEFFHAIPEFVVECLVDDPVEIVCENAGVFTLRPQWRVGYESNGFACSDDGTAFFWG